MLISKHTLTMRRRPELAAAHPEIKDPSIVKVGNEWQMFASIGSSVTQVWKVGRFRAGSIEGIWDEMNPVRFEGLSGPQLCAPAMLYKDATATTQAQWIMYIQTACFQENGVITSAYSRDGELFTGVSSSLLRSEMIEGSPHKIVGLYDAGISEVSWNGEAVSLMVFSGYRSIGNGDLYITSKPAHASDALWSKPQLILSQEQVPFHNQPGSADYEWGLEGAKVIQLGEHNYLLIGVCFATLPLSYLGHRQRVFLATSPTPFGPFRPIGVPFLPISLRSKYGEIGHPETIIEGNSLWIIYQKRTDKDAPWHLGYAQVDLVAFAQKIAHYNTPLLESNNVQSSSRSPYFFTISRSL